MKRLTYGLNNLSSIVWACSRCCCPLCHIVDHQQATNKSLELVGGGGNMGGCGDGCALVVMVSSCHHQYLVFC